jgi:hypothetical protein
MGITLTFTMRTMMELDVDIFFGTAGPRGLPIFWMVRGDTTTLVFSCGSDPASSAQRFPQVPPHVQDQLSDRYVSLMIHCIL